MKVFDALSQAIELLKENTANPRQEAEWLLSFLLDSDRSHLLAHYRDDLNDSVLSNFFSQVRQRIQGKPLQFIVGRQEFRALEFEVSRDVLIPRPETELVVEEVLYYVRALDQPTLVDLGTGSGCIAVALAVELPQARVFALDLSQPALEIARRNAARHKVADRIQFLQGNLLDPMTPIQLQETIDCIASNPPYVSERDFPHLQREVREWEPKLALVAGDGLSIYHQILPQALRFLRTGGYLVVEIGFNMRDAVCGLFDDGWRIVKVKEDLSGIPRVVVGQKL
jgi:release factor glutamine methyltransferase